MSGTTVAASKVVAGGGRVPASCGGAGQRGWLAGRDAGRGEPMDRAGRDPRLSL